MDETSRPNFGHPEPVDFLPMPTGPERDAVLNERRRYSRLMAEAAGEMKRLYDAAYTDSLTGLGNRRLFEEEFPKLFDIAKEKQLPIALAYGDVRGLKRVNDNDGHTKGDQLLQASGEALKSIAREGDVLIRLGGDEFVIVMLGYAPVEGQLQEGLDQETIDRLKNNFDLASQAYGIPAERHAGIDLSITTMQAGDTPESMLMRADAQMQAQKDAYYADLSSQGTTFTDRRIA